LITALLVIVLMVVAMRAFFQAGNPVVESSNPLSLATIVLKGSTTARTGQTPAQFTMPAFAWRLDDQEIADVLTLVRSVWGNKGPAVDKAAIAKLRADLH